MDLPKTARGLLAALEAPTEAPALRLRILGFDHEALCDVVEVELDGERATLHAHPGGYIAVLTPLPWGVSLDDLRPAVGRLIGGRPERWQRRNP